MKRNLYLVFFAACFLCIAICGCVAPVFPCEDPDSYPYWTEWSNGSLVYIIDDSLAVLSTHRRKVECKVLSYKREGTASTRSRAGLFLVNYRTKKEPLFGDTLELGHNQSHDLGIPTGYFKDSSVLVFDLENDKFGFWKIGDKSIKFNEYTGIIEFGLMNAGSWINENVIFSGFTNVLYIDIPIIYQVSHILDSEKRQIKPFFSPEGHEWFQQKYCTFLSYIEGKVVCVSPNLVEQHSYYPEFSTEHSYYSELIVDGLVVDGIATDTTNFFGGNVRWFGNYIKQNRNGEVFKIDTENLKFDKDFKLWLSSDFTKFYNDINNPNNFVSYSGQDLIDFISKGGTK